MICSINVFYIFSVIIFQFLQLTLLRVLKSLSLVKLLIFTHITIIYFEPKNFFFLGHPSNYYS